MDLTKRQLSDGTVVVAFGEPTALDASTSDTLRQLLGEVGDSYARVVLDLTEVTFIDSSALGALVALMRKVKGKGGALHVAGLRPSVKLIFEVTRLDRVFSIHGTTGEAEAALIGT